MKRHWAFLISSKGNPLGLSFKSFKLTPVLQRVIDSNLGHFSRTLFTHTEVIFLFTLMSRTSSLRQQFAMNEIDASFKRLCGPIQWTSSHLNSNSSSCGQIGCNTEIWWSSSFPQVMCKQQRFVILAIMVITSNMEDSSCVGIVKRHGS